MDGAASDDEEISALGASPARPRAGGSAASSPTLSLPESFSNLGGEPAPLARQLESELAATHERRAAEREAYHARLAAARRDADAARRQADAQAVELARATEALRDRRDAIDDGFLPTPLLPTPLGGCSSGGIEAQSKPGSPQLALLFASSARVASLRSDVRRRKRSCLRRDAPLKTITSGRSS